MAGSAAVVTIMTAPQPPSAPAEIYRLLLEAADVPPPSWRQLGTTRWVMNLEWYKAIRRAVLPEDADDDARDEEKWVPDPGDTLLGIDVTVTEDGGMPHLVDGRLGILRALIDRQRTAGG